MDEQKEVSASTQAHALLDRIATEAYDKTGGDVWGTEPPPTVDSPPATDKPAEEKPAASPDETLAKEPTSEPTLVLKGDLAKKYKTPEEAERGYFEAVRMGNEAKARADAAEARLASVEKAVSPGPTPPAEEDPLDAIESYGVPKELIAKAIDNRIQKAIPQYFAPAIQITQADKAIIEKYPEYEEKFSEIEQFAKSDPTVWQQIGELNEKGNYLAARQIAYLNWKVAEATKVVETKAVADTVRKEEAKAAMVDAGVGSPRRSNTRTAPETPEMSKDEEKRLLDLYKQGHTTPYLRAKLDGLLGPDFDKATAQVLG